MTRYVRVRNTIVATLVVFSMVAAVTVVGAGALLAGTQEASATHDSPGDYTVNLPNEDDHLPGDQNPEGASIQHFAALDGGFDDAPANRYEVLEWLVISSDEVDFSGCETQDTGGFGIDRGNDNEGTQYDEDLLKHRKDSAFLDSKIWVQFYSDDDFGGESIGIREQDAIVAYQNSCYTMPEEPGWYQINGKINGTSPDGEFMETSLTSHYFPICEGCHDEDTAREKLGPPPSEEGSGTDPTPTPTESGGEDTPESTATDEPAATATATAEPDDEPASTATATDTSDDGTPEPAATEDGSTGGDGGTDGDGGVQGTPTPGDGPGFTGVAALLALLAAALLAGRRR